jgi:N-acyl-D-aspartate/D-glutamate deacylase
VSCIVGFEGVAAGFIDVNASDDPDALRDQAMREASGPAK